MKIIKHKLKGIILIFIGFFFLFLVSFQTDKNTLLWQEDRLLTWDDFKGKPEKRFAAASTHYDILKKIIKENDKSATVKIEAVFFRNSSWKKKSWINEQVLAHEQKHFDIVELYSRKLRKAIEEKAYKSFNELEDSAEELYTKYDQEMDVYQDKYDDETDGSMNGDQQRAWEKKIMQEVKALDKYKETVLKISFE